MASFVRPLLAALLLSIVPGAHALRVTVSPENPLPGDVLKVEIHGLDNPSRAACVFDGKDYPFFATSPGKLRALIGLTARREPGAYPLEVRVARFLMKDAVVGRSVEVGFKKFTHQYLTLPEKKTKLASRPGAREALHLIRDALSGLSPRQRWRGVLLRPTLGRRTSKYGHTRTINRRMSWDWHKGIDIAAGEGAPVFAPAGGRVVLTGRFPVQGGTLILDHGQGLMSAFLHLHSFAVETGRLVRAGERVANVGGGGFSTGSHLHWGVYLHGDAVDPEALLAREP